MRTDEAVIKIISKLDIMFCKTFNQQKARQIIGILIGVDDIG